MAVIEWKVVSVSKYHASPRRVFQVSRLGEAWYFGSRVCRKNGGRFDSVEDSAETVPRGHCDLVGIEYLNAQRPSFGGVAGDFVEGRQVDAVLYFLEVK